MEKKLLSGNEAIARGAYEAGVKVAAGYPGTPSTEILENAVKYKDKIYCEWAPNEKVAFEVAAAAAQAGARSITTMKHVGLNVAADPLMTLSYVGVDAGMVICVADDPGMHSSQNEQDSRNYAVFAKIPLLEPADSQEAKDYLIEGIRLSEKYRVPVILRTTTRVSHSKSLVEIGERQKEHEVGFQKNPQRYVPVPVWGRVMREQVEMRLEELKKEAEESRLNTIEENDSAQGIICSSITYQYVKEVWPTASVLKLGYSYPYPDKLIKKFASKVEELRVIEELDPLLEEHVKALGLKCKGRSKDMRTGELSCGRLREKKSEKEKIKLPARPPVLCAGCPHRGVFYTLKKHEVVVTGDIGCYSLGTFKPLERLDTILCMGAGISMAHGMEKAGEKRKVVGIVGDSTFFHSGITGLLDIAYNKGKSTIIVLDNRTTAMTGHQDHPGTGKTLMGEATREASIMEFGKACGIQRIREIDPYDLEETEKAIKEEIEADQASLIVAKAPCALKVRAMLGPQKKIDAEKCKNCRLCLGLGCPALEAAEKEKPKVNSYLCVGCSLCSQICPFQAISEVEK